MHFPYNSCNKCYNLNETQYLPINGIRSTSTISSFKLQDFQIMNSIFDYITDNTSRKTPFSEEILYPNARNKKSLVNFYLFYFYFYIYLIIIL